MVAYENDEPVPVVEPAIELCPYCGISIEGENEAADSFAQAAEIFRGATQRIIRVSGGNPNIFFAIFARAAGWPYSLIAQKCRVSKQAIGKYKRFIDKKMPELAEFFGREFRESDDSLSQQKTPEDVMELLRDLNRAETAEKHQNGTQLELFGGME